MALPRSVEVVVDWRKRGTRRKGTFEQDLSERGEWKRWWWWWLVVNEQARRAHRLGERGLRQERWSDEWAPSGWNTGASGRAEGAE